jgi:hypothetical protein
VSRDRGLWDTQDLNQITHAELAWLHQGKDSETNRVLKARNIRSIWDFAAAGIFAYADFTTATT